MADGYLNDNFYSTGEIHTPTVLEMKTNGDLTVGQDSLIKQKVQKRNFLSDLIQNPVPAVIGIGAGVLTGSPTVGLAVYAAMSNEEKNEQYTQEQQDAMNAQLETQDDSLELAKTQYADYKENYEDLMENAVASLESDSVRYDLAMDTIEGLYSDNTEDNAKYKARVDNNLNKLNQDITKFDLVADKAIQGYVHSSAKTAKALEITSQTMATTMAANTAEYNLHKSMFGTTQQNMMDYMNNLDSKSFSANTKAHLNANYAKVMKSLDGVMSKRSILDSGMYDENVVNRSFELATARAGADVSAEKEVLDLQSKWLQFGDASKVNLDANMQIATAGVQAANNVKAGDANTALSANTYSAAQTQFKTNVATNSASTTDPFKNAFAVMNSIGANPATNFYTSMLGGASQNVFGSGVNLQNAYTESANLFGNNANIAGTNLNNSNNITNSLINQGVTAAANTDWSKTWDSIWTPEQNNTPTITYDTQQSVT